MRLRGLHRAPSRTPSASATPRYLGLPAGAEATYVVLGAQLKRLAGARPGRGAARGSEESPRPFSSSASLRRFASSLIS
ncbi:MAG: hypothetical protein ACP5II_08265 [Infirmifilum sp.]|uniref:hypothetical protein n=1 Tax=Infirmifilum sp. TaxID=2856575 RepID=UPI003D132BCD